MTAAASLASASAYCTCSFQAARPNTRAHGQRRLAVTSQATHEVTDPPVIVLGGTGRVKREGSLNVSAACRLHAIEPWQLGWH